MRPREIAAMIGLRPPSRRGPVARRLARCHDIDDLRAAARRRLPGPVFDYVDGGADDETSLERNREAFRRIAFHPRTLVDVSGTDPSTTLLGRAQPLPMVLAPTGYSRMMHPDGEQGVARAAARAGLPYTLSTVASTSIEDVAATGHPARWFQLYLWRDRDMVADLVRRAQAHGYGVLEVSVDVPVSGLRRRDVRNGLTIPPQLTARTLASILSRPSYWIGMVRSPAVTFANAPPSVDGSGGVTIENMSAQFDPSVDWADVEALRRQWPGRLLVKGPLSPDDARRALEAGADGVHLSNHGGRQLDRIVPPIRTVPAVRAALGPDATIVVDSGIRHGADVVAAVALGADAGAIGRAYLYGLMAAGEPGVDHALALLAAQVRRTMQLLGVTSVAELRERGPELVVLDRA
ncbi:MAG TPA: alpha-hydroxy acid oxidase [Baekduia sp.]|nr:alpha-hydroxy acid oxidase [Baekduia sp.]